MLVVYRCSVIINCFIHNMLLSVSRIMKMTSRMMMMMILIVLWTEMREVASHHRMTVRPRPRLYVAFVFNLNINGVLLEIFEYYILFSLCVSTHTHQLLHERATERYENCCDERYPLTDSHGRAIILVCMYGC